MKAVGQPIRKKDAMALVTGKPVFMDDLAPKDCLIVKVLRSPQKGCRELKTFTHGKMCRRKDLQQQDRPTRSSAHMTG
mgnify:CR=1 FL=1